MNTPLDEVKRLRAQLDEKDRQLAELRGLVAAHLEASSDAPELALRREQDAFERGYDHGDEMGWRRGVEHALMAVDDAHMEGNCHDEHGQMRMLGLHKGPVPERLTPEQIVAKAEADERKHAEWWFREYQRTHPEGQRETAPVRQICPKGRDAEREAV